MLSLTSTPEAIHNIVSSRNIEDYIVRKSGEIEHLENPAQFEHFLAESMVDNPSAVFEQSGQCVGVPNCYAVTSQPIHFLQDMPGIDGYLLRCNVHALSVPPTVSYKLHANHRKVFVVDNTLKNGSTTKEDPQRC